jgi:tetratricopeptide (TPR) repeat protein
MRLDSLFHVQPSNWNLESKIPGILMQSKLQVLSRSLMEAAWLTAAAIIPLFFSISSAQTFEPDKIFVLRSVAVLSGAAWLLSRITAGREGFREQVGSFLRKPLVKPVLAFGAIYLLSAVFSIAPSLSWWGSYKRSQGVGAFLCYLILFLTAVSELRTRAQLKRLQYILLLASIPVSVYAILQRVGMDPIPWSAIPMRSSGSMGNPIFLGGYLVMVIPLTFYQILEGLKERCHRVFIASCAIAALLQLAALFCTQSRGPVLGLAVAAYFCVFIYLVLNRTREKGRSVLYGAIFGLGLAGPGFLLLASRFASGLSSRFVLASIAGAAALIAVLYFVIWRTAWGRGRLWLAWLTQVLALLLIFTSPAGVVRRSFGLSASLGRLAQLSNASVDVRISLWETGIRYLRAGAPAVLPDGTRDAHHRMRPVIGYGPEGIGLASNIYAVPSLVQKNELEFPDRMHNETFDNLITLGFAGSVIWLIIMAAALFYALRCLGFASEPRGRTVFILLSGFGILSGAVAPLAYGAFHLIGIGVELGLLAGVFAFIASSGFRAQPLVPETNIRPLFILGIFGALIAHFIETSVGVAVTPTRVYFYLFLASLSVLSTRNLAFQEESANKRPAQSVLRVNNPLIVYALLSGIVVLVESWCFMFNTADERSAVALFFRNFFPFFSGAGQGHQFPVTLLLLLLTICGSIGLMYLEKPDLRISKSKSQNKLKLSPVLIAVVWIIMGLSSAYFWTGLGNSSPLDAALHAENRMTILIVGLLLLVVSLAALIMPSRGAMQNGRFPIRKSEIGVGIVIFVCAMMGIWRWTLCPAWADISCRLAGIYETAGSLPAAVQLYERTSLLEPHTIQYWISLGRAQGAAGISDPAMLKQAVLSLERALDLNPLDPESCRTLAAFHMQTGERSSDPAVRTAEINTAISLFRKASRLAPNFPDAHSEIGRCFMLLGEYEQANSLYQESLQLNPNYWRTYMFLGEMQYRLKNLEGALRNFSEAARLNPRNIEPRKNVGFLLALLGRREEAIRTNLETLEQAPGDAVLLTRLSALYFSTGNYGAGIDFGRRAYESTPASGRPGLDEFIEKLKNSN